METLPHAPPPHHDPVHSVLLEAERLLARGQPAQAEACVSPVLLSARLDGWVIAATAAWEQGEPDRAAGLLARGRALGATTSLGEGRAAMRARLDQRLQAWALLRELAGGQPPLGDAPAEELIRRGEAQFAEGVMDQATASFLCALGRRPDWETAWLDLGVALHQAGAAPEAERCLRVATGLGPSAGEAWVALAELLIRTGRIIEAASVLRDRLEIAPRDEQAHALLRRMGVEGPRPPALLLVDVDDPLAEVYRLHGADQGLLIRHAHPELLGLLAEMLDSPERARAELLDRVSPVGLVLGPTSAPGWAALCAERGISVHTADPSQAGALVSELARRAPRARAAHAPLLSVIVPTYSRHRCALNLLDAVALQDLDPSFVEVCLVDDGSPSPLSEALGPQERHYTLDLLRQPNAGPAAARNRALTQGTAPWVVIYNDDTVPALDNLRRHLVEQIRTTRAGQPEAVLGRFDFPEERCDTQFMHLLQHSTRLFLYPWMRPGQLHSWIYLFSCNISLPREALEAVGGFDADRFPRAICEDTELGVRLQTRLGLRVRYRPEIKATHDHDLDVDGYARRAFLLGFYQHRIWEKHRTPEVMWAAGTDDPDSDQTWLKIRAVVEKARRNQGDLMADARRLAALPVPDHPDQRAELHRFLDRITGYILGLEARRGHIHAREGWGDDPTPPAPHLTEQLTSVIIPNLNGWPHVQGTIQSLRRTTIGPMEIIVVDNGSTDRGLEWLREQDDIDLIELGSNMGAPAARNRGLERARGETVLFCDNDVVFTPHWRARLIWHLEQWPDIGMVAPMSDVVVGAQRLADPPGPEQDLDAWSEAFAQEQQGRHEYRGRLILLCLLVKREVIDRIGGIDEAFSPWGFEDDDFSVRAATAGFRLRVAGDVFVRHLGSQTEKPAGLDYGALLHANWETFKRKWGMDPSLPYGQPYDSHALARRKFDPALHHVSITPRPS